MTGKKQDRGQEKKGEEAPRFIELLQGVSAVDGDPITLQCRIAGEGRFSFL